MGTQISILTQQDAKRLSIQLRWPSVKVTGVNGASVICQSAKVNLWLSGKTCMVSTHFAVKDHNENILSFDVLKGQIWQLLDGSIWSFGSNGKPNPDGN